MHGDLRSILGPEGRVQRLNRKACRTLARVVCSLANEGRAGLTLPVPCSGLKIETDDTAAGLTVDHDDRRCYARSGVVDHIAQSVESALHGEEFFRLHLRRRWKIIALPPREMGVRRHRDFVGVTQIQ